MIEVFHACKSYRSGRGSVTALEDISFRVEKGGRLVVAGKSGSGKTTLLNCVGGLERPDQGRIVCAGTDLNALSRRRLSRFQRKRIGFVFQTGNLLSYLTVRENLAFPLELNGISGAARDRRIQELLDHIGVPEVSKALPHELSGGEMQRVAFARAIAHSPAILLADEPTASLDSANSGHLIRLMLSLAKKQLCTLVIATHDPEVMDLADEILRLKDGKEDFR